MPRRKSTASAADDVNDEALPLPDIAPGKIVAWRDATDEQFLRECHWDAFRASGPGGQKRNKTSSAVRVVHDPTRLFATASESRSQAENRRRALKRLRHRMVLALRLPVSIHSWTHPAWWPDVIDRAGRLAVTARHPLYLPLVGQSLDVLHAAAYSISEAAHLLGLTTAGFVRFLQQDEPLLAHVNQCRVAVGLRSLGSRD